MATPAAYLDIVVDLNTGTASTDLRRLNSSLSKFDRTQATATTRTSSLGKATSTLGTRMRSAAGYAAGAAAAYLSISQAKAAVTTTQDLAKTTAGLNRNLGLSVKTSSQWGAVAKSRDIDTKSLNMSFTTLSKNLVEAKKGTQANVEQFNRLGISQEELKGLDFDQSLLRVADAFGEAEGGAVRQATAQKLLGRGYQTVLPLFAEGSKSLEEQLGWADKYGAELSGDTLKSQMDLVNAQRESKVAMLGLQVAFTTALTPALQRANEEFQRISEIMSSDKLTKEEKWQRVGQIIGKWGDKAFDAFIGIFPKLVSKVGEKVPEVAAAFVQGFLQSDVWGKLLIGGWLLSKFGGMSAFSLVGTRAGTAFGRAFRLGIIASFLLLLPDAYEFGKKLGREVKRGLKQSEFMQDAADMVEQLFGLTDKLSKREAIGGVKGLLDKDEIGLEDAMIALEKAGVKTKRAREIINNELGYIAVAGKNTNTSVSRDAKEMGDNIDEHTGRGANKGSAHARELKNKTTSSSQQMATQVMANVASMVTGSLTGIGHLTSETSKALRAFGVDPLKYTPKALAKGATETITGGILGHQRGGKIGGTGTGDTVPAMLESGEYVMNRKAVAGIGKDRLDQINFGKYSRFQAGGMAGLNPGISRLAQWAADRYGLSISSGLRAGDSGSYHSQGAAVDLVPPSMTATRGIFGAFKNQLAELFYDPWGGWDSGQMIPAIGGHMDHIHAAILGAGGPAAMAAKLARVMLKGPKGPLRSMGQSALDKVYKGANQYLSKQTMTSHGAVGNASGAQSLGRQMMLNAGWGQGQWPALLELWTRESGWDPNAVNPSSGAYGIPQSLGHGHPYALGDARAQIAWGLDYIRDRYGSPSAALAFHNANNWYSKGGIVGNYAAGGDVSRSGLARVHKGERISPPGTPHVEIVLNGSMDAVLDEVDVLIDGRKAEIADYTLREGGRTRGRARQMAGR